MINKESRQWIKIAKIICDNKKAKVLCPKCGQDFLIVEDVEASENKFERVMRCEKCGAYNAMLKTKKI